MKKICLFLLQLIVLVCGVTQLTKTVSAQTTTRVITASESGEASIAGELVEGIDDELIGAEVETVSMEAYNELEENWMLREKELMAQVRDLQNQIGQVNQLEWYQETNFVWVLMGAAGIFLVVSLILMVQNSKLRKTGGNTTNNSGSMFSKDKKVDKISEFNKEVENRQDELMKQNPTGLPQGELTLNQENMNQELNNVDLGGIVTSSSAVGEMNMSAGEATSVPGVLNNVSEANVGAVLASGAPATGNKLPPSSSVSSPVSPAPSMRPNLMASQTPMVTNNPMRPEMMNKSGLTGQVNNMVVNRDTAAVSPTPAAPSVSPSTSSTTFKPVTPPSAPAPGVAVGSSSSMMPPGMMPGADPAKPIVG